MEPVCWPELDPPALMQHTGEAGAGNRVNDLQQRARSSAQPGNCPSPQARGSSLLPLRRCRCWIYSQKGTVTLQFPGSVQAQIQQVPLYSRRMGGDFCWPGRVTPTLGEQNLHVAYSARREPVACPELQGPRWQSLASHHYSSLFHRTVGWSLLNSSTLHSAHENGLFQTIPRKALSEFLSENEVRNSSAARAGARSQLFIFCSLCGRREHPVCSGENAELIVLAGSGESS